MRWVLLVMILAGCQDSIFGAGDGGTDGQGPDGKRPHELSIISMQPTNKVLELDLQQATKLTYKAVGYFEDGKSEEITSGVTWTSSNPKLGTFSGATLVIPAMNKTEALVTMISAQVGSIVGQAQLTVVAYRKTGTKTDFFFVLPYMDKLRKYDNLDFKTDVRTLDVFFVMDTTSSMTEEIQNLQTGLKAAVIPGIQAQIPGTQFGVGALMDFPVKPYGVDGKDQPFMLFQTITSDTAAMQAAVNKYSSGGRPIGHGEDWPEATIEALYQIATGQGLNGPASTKVPANSSGVGGVGFRKGSMPVAVVITDAMSHAPGEKGYCSKANADYSGAVAKVAHTRAHAKGALDKICAKVVGIAPIFNTYPECSGLKDLEDFARTSGAQVPPATWDVPQRPPNCAKGKCCTDFGGAGRVPDPGGLCPLVFKVKDNGTGLSGSIVSGIKMLTRYAPFDVATQLVGQQTDIDGKALPSGKSSADFIQALQPVSYKKPSLPSNLPNPIMDSKGFSRVTPGTTVTFKVEAYNDFLNTSNEARIFRAVIKVRAGGCTDLDQREVLILIPPSPIM